MNKYGWLVFTLLSNVLLAYISNEIVGLNNSGSISHTIPDSATIDTSTVGTFFQTYFNLLTFNVTGIPAIVSVYFIITNIIFGFIFVTEILIPSVEAIIPL